MHPFDNVIFGHESSNQAIDKGMPAHQLDPVVVKQVLQVARQLQQEVSHLASAKASDSLPAAANQTLPILWRMQKTVIQTKLPENLAHQRFVFGLPRHSRSACEEKITRSAKSHHPSKTKEWRHYQVSPSTTRTESTSFRNSGSDG